MLLSANSTVDVVFTEFAGFDECILWPKVYIRSLVLENRLCVTGYKGRKIQKY